MATAVAMQYFPKASTDFNAKLPLIANENAYLADIASSYDATDETAPISAGFYRLEPGTPLVYEYHYHEMKIIVSGSFEIEDEAGNTAKGVAGDVFYFPKGSKITFRTTEGGLAFFTGQRKEGTA